MIIINTLIVLVLALIGVMVIYLRAINKRGES